MFLQPFYEFPTRRPDVNAKRKTQHPALDGRRHRLVQYQPQQPGLMGYHTPNIDRIAREGVEFTDYYGQQAAPPAGQPSSPVKTPFAPV